MCVCVSHKIRPSGQRLFKAMHHPINSLSTADKRLIPLSLLRHYAWSHTFFTPLPLCEHFPLRILAGECTHLFVCYVCASNDAVGHDRRWHLLLMVTPAHGGALRPSPGRGKTRGKEERHTPALTPIHPTPGENTHYRHRGPSNGNVLGGSSFLIIHADLRSHSEFSPKRTGHFLSLCRKTHSETFFEVALLSRRMFSEETASRFSLYEKKSPSGYCQWHYRKRICVLYEMNEMSTGVSLKGKRGRGVVCVCVYVYAIVWVHRQGSVEAGSRCGWLMVAVWMENFSGSAPVNWWELMQ